MSKTRLKPTRDHGGQFNGSSAKFRRSPLDKRTAMTLNVPVTVLALLLASGRQTVRAQAAADSIALARAAPSVLIERQVPVRPLPPDEPSGWEVLLLRQLHEFSLPGPSDELLWVHVRDSRVTMSELQAEVTVHTEACIDRDRDRGFLDGHLMVYSFERADEDWTFTDRRMKLSGSGSSDSAGPMPEPGQ